MKHFLSTSVAIAIAVTCCSELHATNRYYSDLETESESGRYKFTARSPDNDDKTKHTPFQKNFVFSLVDTASGKVVWTRQQGQVPDAGGEVSKDESSPMRLMVSNDGSSVIHTAWNDLLCATPTGKTLPTVNILDDVLTDLERKRFVQHTTAGPRWASMSMWYFVQEHDDTKLIIRPWWGRRMVVRLADANSIQPSDAIENAAVKYESEFVRNTLASSLTLANRAECTGTFNLRKAIYLAGCLNLHNQIQLLRHYETSEISCCSSTDGAGEFGSYREFTIRQIAQLSLRRLGEKPRLLPARVFEQLDASQRDVEFVAAKMRQRDRNAANIVKGMTKQQVYNLLGPPDYTSWGWSYDFDSAPANSLTIQFDYETAAASKITRQKPPIWKTGLERDEAIAN